MHAMENISKAFEWVGVAVLILAFMLALLSVARLVPRASGRGFSP
jgi:hypothetical protein